MAGEVEASLQTEATCSNDEAPEAEQASLDVDAAMPASSEMSIEQRLLDQTLSKTQRKKLLRRQMCARC
eukprot:6712196-Pyramimonas_sp.AAC.1